MSQLKKPPEVGKKEALVGSEILNGLRCGGCLRRITHGVKLIGFKAQTGQNGQPQMRKRMVAACLREDCSYAESMKSSAHLMEPLEYLWCSGDPDPDGVIAKRLASG